jgi:Carboxypeptidase regulatory-like domain
MSPAVISGAVRDPRGLPVAQARVYFIEGPGPLPDIAALTDDNGRFSMSAPAPGIYRLECQADGFSPARATVTIEGDRPAVLDFLLTA